MMPATPRTMPAKRIQPWPRSFMVNTHFNVLVARQPRRAALCHASRYIPGWLAWEGVEEAPERVGVL